MDVGLEENAYEMSRFLSGPNMPEQYSQLDNSTIENAICKRIPDVSMMNLVVFSDAIGIGLMIPKHLRINGTGEHSDWITLTVKCSPLPLTHSTLMNAIDQAAEEIKKERKVTGIIKMIGD